MVYLVFFLLSLAALYNRAIQKERSPSLFVFLAGIGWVAFYFGLVPGVGAGAGLALCWIWVGLVYLVLELSNRGLKSSRLSWQCPNCLTYNDPGAVRCLCGFRNPDDEPELEPTLADPRAEQHPSVPA